MKKDNFSLKECNNSITSSVLLLLLNNTSLPMIDNDTPEEINNFKDLKNAGQSSIKTIKFGPSIFLIAKLVNYSHALQVVNTSKVGNFFLILN